MQYVFNREYFAPRKLPAICDQHFTEVAFVQVLIVLCNWDFAYKSEVPLYTELT